MERYDAFISYSQRVERPLVVALQREMEDLGRPRYRRRTLRVFRDTANLGASAGLWSSVERALAASEWFVLVASEEAARSEWVRREVTWWLEHRTADRMLIALLDGAIVWTGDDFAFPASTALPPVLANRFAEEPHWIDLRPHRAGTLVGPETVADLVAPIRGVERDSLVGQHLTMQRRSRRLIRAVVAGLTALTVASVVATVVAVTQQRTAERERTRAEAQAREATSRRLADLSLRSPGRDESLQYLLAAQAYRLAETTAARGALFQLTQTESDFVGFLAKEKQARIVGHRNGVVAAAFAPSGARVATVDGGGTVRVAELATAKISTVTVEGARDIGFVDDTHAVVASPAGLHSVDAVTGKVAPVHREGVAALAVLGDGMVLCLGTDGGVALVGPDGVRQRAAAPVSGGATLRLAARAKVAVVQGAGGVAVIDTTTLAARSTWDPAGRRVAAVSPDGTRAIVLAQPDTLENVVADVVDTATGKAVWKAETNGWFVPRGAAFLPDGASITVATSGGVDGKGGQLWTHSAGTPKADFPTPLPVPAEIAGIWPSADGSRLVVASGTGAAEILTVARQNPNPIYPLSATADGARVLVRTAGGLGVSDLDTGAVAEVTTGKSGVLTPDGRSIVTDDGRIVDTGSRAVRHTGLPAIAPEVKPLFLADGVRMLYASTTGTLVLLHTDTGRVFTVRSPIVPDPSGNHQLAAGPDGSIAAVRGHTYSGAAGSDVVATFRITGDTLAPLAQSTRTDVGEGGLAFTADGRRLMRYSGETVGFLDPTTLEPVGENYFSQAEGPWFPSPDRRTVVASSCRIRFVDVATFQTVAEAPGPTEIEGGCDGRFDVAWTASGRSLLIGMDGEPFNRYLFHGPDLFMQACRLAGRNLTTAEWSQYLPDRPFERTCPTTGDAGSPTAVAASGTSAAPATSAAAGSAPAGGTDGAPRTAGAAPVGGTGDAYRDLAAALNPDIPQCPANGSAPEGGCLKIVRQDDRQAVLALAQGGEYSDYYLLDKQNGRWTVTDEYEVTLGEGASEPSWLR